MASDGTLSGAGDAAILATTNGRMVKVALDTGAGVTLIPPTAVAVSPLSYAFGSLYRMRGAFPGNASDWEGRILFGGQAAAVLSAKPGELEIQVPWLPARGTIPFRIVGRGDSPFEQNETILASGYAMSLVQAAPGEASLMGYKASNGDGSGPPPIMPGPGDMFRLYFTGLGPVENPPALGAKTPQTPASPIRVKLACRFPPHTLPIETVSATLEPGTVGVYQATFRLSKDSVAAKLVLASCELCGSCAEEVANPLLRSCGDSCLLSGTGGKFIGRGWTPVP